MIRRDFEPAEAKHAAAIRILSVEAMVKTDSFVQQVCKFIRLAIFF